MAENEKKEPGGKKIPSYDGTLRSHMIKIPECVAECSGIRVFGRRIKSLAFTTDVAIIRNINTDAIMSVYPFTPQPTITRAIMDAADMPVFVGVGGGVTHGRRVLGLASDAEREGAAGVVVNDPTPNLTIFTLKQILEIPVIVTVVAPDTDVSARLDAGADIINVAGAARTPEIVAKIRQEFPDVPIMATGGNTEESILATIRAGANAVTYTPPTSSQLFTDIMQGYRKKHAEKER